MSPALQGSFLTTGPQEKSLPDFFVSKTLISNVMLDAQ